MALMLANENILLLQVPGTASSALEQAVLQLPGGRLVGGKHATLPELQTAGLLNGAGPAGGRPLEVVALVRNHYDQLHSEWYRSRTRWIMEIDQPDTVGGWPARKRLHIKMCVVKDFSDYLLWAFADENRAGRQLWMYAGFVDHCTRVFRMEDLAAFQSWLSERTQASVELPRYNVTERPKPYWMDYTREARDLVSRLFRDELELYGYSF